MKKITKQQCVGMFNELIDDNCIRIDYDDLKKTVSDRELIGHILLKEQNFTSITSKLKKLILKLRTENLSLAKSDGVLVHFIVHSKHKLDQLTELVDIISDDAPDSIDIIWGSACDDNLSKEFIQMDLFVSYQLS